MAADDTFDVSVLVSTNIQSRGGMCGLTFSPTIVECTGVTVGTFYSDWASSHGGTTMPFGSFTINNTAGTVARVGIAIFGGDPGGPMGSGVLYTYHFHALQEGVATLTLTETSVSDHQGNDITPPTLQVNNGQVSVGTGVTEICIGADINCDGCVNIEDAVILGLHWQLQGTPPEYREDIDNSGLVTIADAVILGLHWLEGCI